MITTHNILAALAERPLGMADLLEALNLNGRELAGRAHERLAKTLGAWVEAGVLVATKDGMYTPEPHLQAAQTQAMALGALAQVAQWTAECWERK